MEPLNLTKEREFVKKFLIAAGVLAALFLITWGVCEAANSGSYAYQGYITDVLENENGETVLVTLSETAESTFTIKWYTRKSASKKQAIAVGDRIMLSTTHYSDTNIKKMKIAPGYSTEGKLVYADGLISPFVLARAKETQMPYLVSAIRYTDTTSDGPKTGDTVRIYHAYPAGVSVAVEGSVVIAEGASDALTPEEIAFVESQGYMLQSE